MRKSDARRWPQEGLEASSLCVAAAVVGAAVVGGVASSSAQKSASKSASNAQIKSAEAGVAEHQRQFDAMQKLLSPYSQAATGGGSPTQQIVGLYQQYLGRNPNADTLSNWVKQIGSGEKTMADAERIISTGPGAQQYALSGNAPQQMGSLDAQRNLLGLNGNAAQASAIQALQGSPQFTSMLQQGENSILQNASATGGLRGGNTQAALAQFSPALLAQTINDQYARLGGLTSLGQNAAAMQGNAGMQTGNNIANLLAQSGSAQAGNALAQGRAQAGMWNSLAGGIGSYAGMGGFGQPTAAVGGATSGGLMSELGSYGVF